MLIIRVAGGLGNQMQQYALYRKLQSLGKDVKLDLSWFDQSVQENMLAPRELELRRFQDLPMDVAGVDEVRRLTGGSGLAGRVLRKLGRAKIFEESEMYHPEIFSMDERYLMGYFACNKYYADILPQLRKEFVFPKAGDTSDFMLTLQERNERIMREMEDPEVFSVAIHIRRGDYLDSANADILGGICTPAYYNGAVRYLEELERAENARATESGKTAENILTAQAEGTTKASRIHFYIFSDDPEFAKAQSFGSKGQPVTVCDWNTGADNMLDMQLMSHCRALIAANSTFSFWGGRLNARDDRILIRPLYHRNNQKPDPVKMHDLWEGWTLIDRDGEKC